MKKRILSTLLVLCLILTLFPMSVLASDTTSETSQLTANLLKNSTKITIKNETLRSKDDGTNTLPAESRTRDETTTQKETTQNNANGNIDSIKMRDGVRYIPYASQIYHFGFDEIDPRSNTSFIYQISRGTLPSGLTLDSNTGLISGTPMAIGDWDFQIEIILDEAEVEPPTGNESDDNPGGQGISIGSSVVGLVPDSRENGIIRREEQNTNSEEQSTVPEGENTNPEKQSTAPESENTTPVSPADTSSSTDVSRNAYNISQGNLEAVESYSKSHKQWFRLSILDNEEDPNLPVDYEILEPFGTPDPRNPKRLIITEYEDTLMRIDGPFQDFTRLNIDGQELILYEDYEAIEGSTKITILKKTLEKFGEGTHTISAEFRKDRKTGNPLKVTAQNYTVRLSKKSKETTSNKDNKNNKNSKGNTGTQSTSPSTNTSDLPFADVKKSDWFYNDIKFNYDDNLMKGVSQTKFAPQRAISQATIVTVLARMAKIDLSQFENVTEDGITAGQQYTTAAIWAKRSGLLPDGGTFTGAETTTRDQMAIMLAKYLKSIGKDTTMPETRVEFADAANMSQEGNDAFQLLYKAGIFKGVGELKMNPEGSTTRAHFAALIHRIAGI